MKNVSNQLQKLTFLFAALILLSSASSLVAQDEPRTADKPGCADYENISRYKGAVIQDCFATDHDKFVMGLAAPIEKNFREHGKYFAKYMDLEGKIIRIQYLVDKAEGIDKVAANYLDALKGASYNILCNVSNETWPFFNEDYYGGDNPINNIRKYGFYLPSGNRGYHYITASSINKNQNDVFISLFISYGNDFGKEFILVTEEIVEVNPVETGLVTAMNIENMIELNGHISVYGIHFETNKFDILPASAIQLKEIAEFLKSHPEKKYGIVGHTDNTGNFDSNQVLSEQRANAVVDALVGEYGVNPEQLTGTGVSSLAPVTSNSTDQGKARNRRVEIIEW